MNVKECSCGNELLIQMVPQITNINDFRVWKVGEQCPAQVRSTPLFFCPQCGRIELPNTSLSGRNRLDTEYITYEKLLKLTNTHNQKLASEEKQIVSIAAKCDATERKLISKTNELESRITALELLVGDFKVAISALSREEAISEETESSVKTGSRGRKSTKTTE
jgi:hypothetical protein